MLFKNSKVYFVFSMLLFKYQKQNIYIKHILLISFKKNCLKLKRF